jgi:hypothetical protein
MFPTLKLRQIQCPFQPQCNRGNHCYFLHSEETFLYSKPGRKKYDVDELKIQADASSKRRKLGPSVDKVHIKGEEEADEQERMDKAKMRRHQIVAQRNLIQERKRLKAVRSLVVQCMIVPLAG